MRKETISIFTFDELSDKAKEKAINWYRTSNEFEFMPEAMEDDNVAETLIANEYEFTEDGSRY